MGKEQQQSQQFAKLMNPHLHFSHIFRFVFFVIGLSLGITISLNFKSFTINLQEILFSPSSQSTQPPMLHQLSQPLVQLTAHGRLVSDSQPSLLHNMDDNELFRQASLVPRINEFPHEHVPKVAFMFLTKGPIPLSPLWEMFFKGHEGLYTIYIHTPPSYNGVVPEDSVFYGRRIPSKLVDLGQPTMIDAERRLLASALLDYSNERFVLLSESCIPLFNFPTVSNYLLSVNLSFVASYDDLSNVGRGRYNLKMWPTISIFDWRKGSQWLEVNRKLAIEIVSDNKYYPIFHEHCNPPCYMDEHYIPTLVHVCCSAQNSNKTITWVDWSKSGPHAGKFGKQAISVEFLNQIRYGINSTENGNSSSSSTCIRFLFGRKFMPDTLRSLLQIAPVLLGFKS
ncbi:Core-2/I-branching beta-1,6-N-acetylglucosaminyltransferase family protein [Quillaja saponaria]|uniref:Core-2/I-branching beta-1,6-N-acetylglucosaminyltransferase family protein n=1 Tax=Quillaja saponaria TaxID=32244 RepID=A0AAD7M5T7_QUISA|nr:Core-2/I-branching beta-1,6-N-acetylglucosaminyltransferase family protein [Quillaja saponaria]